MANLTHHDRRCSICFRFLTLARRATHPIAKTCGASPCQAEHARRLGALASMHWKRRKRAASDTQVPESDGDVLGGLTGAGAAI